MLEPLTFVNALCKSPSPSTRTYTHTVCLPLVIKIGYIVLVCRRLNDGLKIVLLPGNMSDGVDGGGGENEVDSHSSSHAEAGDSSNHREEEALDADNEAALNTNYDSSDGAVPAFR